MTDIFIEDFIKEYEKQPCLWQASCVDFKNRKKRQEAYLKLIDVASKHGEMYNIERTKQKINNLRCAFRVQLRKYKNSDEQYCPKRKYMENLMFLMNEEKPVNRRRKSSSTIETTDETLIKQRRNIDKELSAITMSLESESDDNIELITNSSATELIKCEENQSIKDNLLEENLVDLIEKQDKIPKISLDDDFEEKIDESTNSNNDDISIIWSSNDIAEIKTIQKSPKTTNSSNVQITATTTTAAAAAPTTPAAVTTNIPGRVVHVRTVKQPVICQAPRIINSTNNKKITSLSQQQCLLTTRSNSLITRSANTQKIQKQSPSTTTATTTLKIFPNAPGEDSLKKTVISSSSMSQSLTERNVPINNTVTTNISKNSSNPPTTVSNLNNNNHTNAHRNKEFTVYSAVELNKGKLQCNANNFEKLLSLACTRINQIADCEDDFGIFGKMVTCKLRGMDSDQALIAQKLITNILFDGQMKILQLSSSSSSTQQQCSGVGGGVQQLHSTTIRPIRNTNVGQTFYISDLNESNERIIGE